MPLTFEEIKANRLAKQQQQVEEEKQENPKVSPEVIEYLSGLQQIEKDGVNHAANVASIGVEIGGGIGGMYALDKAHKAGKFNSLLKTAKTARAASVLGFAGPQALEPVSTVTGAIGFMGSSAAIWGLSNFAGQSVRKAYGLQDEISSGELIASSVFGGLVPPGAQALANMRRSGADKQLLKLTGQTAKDFGAYKKGAYLTINGIKSFASGASLGIAETAVRQELQIALNERENRETYEYLFAGGLGGGLNSILGVWSKTGWWGRRQRSKVTTNAKLSIQKELVNLNKQLKDLEASDDFIFRKKSKIKKLKDKINDTQQAYDIVDDAAKTYKKENDAAQKIETGKSKKNFEDKVETKIAEKITPEDKPFILDEIEDLKNRRKEIAEEESLALNEGRESTRTVKEPSLKKDATDLAEELDEELNNELADFINKEKAGESTEVTLKKIKQIVVNQSELFEKVIGPINAYSGRNLQASSKRRGEFYNYALDSAAGAKRKEALEDLLFAIDTKIKTPTFQGVTGDTFKKIFDDLDVNIEQIKKVNEDIARAVKSKSKDPKIQKLNKTDNKTTIEKLEKELEDLRTKRVDTNEPKNISRSTAPRERVLKEQIKFYKQADKEIKAIVKLEEELEELLKLSPEDFKKLDAEQRIKKDLLTKQQAEAKSSKLKKKIEEAKARLRKQAKKAEKQLKDTEEFEFYAKLENYIYDQLEASLRYSGRRLLATVTASRQLSLLSTASAVAGVPTGIYGISKQFVKPHTTLLRNIFGGKGMSLSSKLYFGDLSSAFAMFSDLSGMFKAAWLSAKRMESVTDPKQAKKLMDSGGTISATPTGTARTFRQTRISAGRRAGAKRNLLQYLDDSLSLGKIANVILSAPLRGIIGVDEAFRRQLYRQVTTATARKKAILQDHFDKNPKKGVMDIEKELLDTAWKKNADGIDIVQETEDFVTGLNFGRQEMFYAASGDSVGDVHISIMEKAIQNLQRVLGRVPELNFVVRAFIPFVDVTIRSVVRGGRIASGPFLPAFYKIFKNPYVRQINKLTKKIDEYETTKKEYLAKQDNKELVAKSTKEIDEEILKIKDRLEKLEYRKIEFNEEILGDAMMGSGFIAAGFAGGLMVDEDGNPLITGSMAFMSREQREKMRKRGIKPFTAFGIPYRAAAPLMMPLAISADAGTYLKFREDGRLEEAQSMFHLLSSSINMITQELPFNSGLKDFLSLIPKDLTNEGDIEKSRRALSRLFGSYAMTPAEVDKLVKYFTTEGKIPDFRKADFLELLMHDAFGASPANFKRDILGRPVKSDKTFLQSTLRYAPDEKIEIKDLADVEALDVNNILGTKTRESFGNIKMLNFRSKSTRLNLHNEFGNRLMKVKVGGKKLESAVNKLIRSRRWKKKFNNGSLSINESGEETNLALEELNSLIDTYYDRVQKDILNESKEFKSSFINRDGETLLDTLNKGKKKGQITRKVKPFKQN